MRAIDRRGEDANVTLVNCFTQRDIERFPSEPVSFVVFALLTEGTGTISIEVVIERLDTLEEIHRVSNIGRFESPLQTVRCKVGIRCTFPEPGHYLVSLLAGGEVVAQRKMILIAKEKKP